MSLSRLAFCMALALPASALAFESVEPTRIDPLDDGAHGSISATLDGRSGNTKRSDYTVGGRLDYRSRDTDMFVLVEHNKAKDRGSNTIENNTWVHAHYRDEFKRGMAAEAFIDGLKDDFRGLDSRSQIGVGARFTLDYQPGDRAVYVGVGALHEWEDQINVDDHYWRLNSYLAYKRQLNENVSGLFNVGYQPRLDKVSDYLVNTELSVLVKMAEHLDLKVGVRHEYDGKAPAVIRSYDTRYLTSLTLSF